MALRHSPHRARCGPLTVVRVASPHEATPGVAYSIPRRVGPAVVRNRIRRRLRALAHELAGGPDPLLLAGDHLVSVRPDIRELPFVQLRGYMAEALARLAQQGLSPGEREHR